jgi:hypothetical protein
MTIYGTIVRLGFILVAVSALPQHANAYAYDCQSAVDAYNSATQDISSYSRRYLNCVSGSAGRDDCSSEFRRLKSAQSDFETAVSDHHQYCRN